MNPVQWLAQSKRRIGTAVAVFALLGLPLYLGVKDAIWAFAPELLPYNSRAPILQGPTLAGGKYDSTRHRGRMLIYVFVDPTLESADRQAKAMASWAQRYQPGQARMVTVLIGGDAGQQNAYAERHDLDPEWVVIDRKNTRAPKFRVFRPPVVYVIDGEGRIRFAMSEGVDAQNRRMQDMLQNYLPANQQRLRRGLP